VALFHFGFAHGDPRRPGRGSPPCLLGVMSGKAQSEHMLSGLPSIADIDRADRNVREVPEAVILTGSCRGRRSAKPALPRTNAACITAWTSRAITPI
jgi:hypothetical protein